MEERERSERAGESMCARAHEGARGTDAMKRRRRIEDA
jgi:hypothetical protein